MRGFPRAFPLEFAANLFRGRLFRDPVKERCACGADATESDAKRKRRARSAEISADLRANSCDQALYIERGLFRRRCDAFVQRWRRGPAAVFICEFSLGLPGARVRLILKAAGAA